MTPLREDLPSTLEEASPGLRAARLTVEAAAAATATPMAMAGAFPLLAIRAPKALATVPAKSPAAKSTRGLSCLGSPALLDSAGGLVVFMLT